MGQVQSLPHLQSSPQLQEVRRRNCKATSGSALLVGSSNREQDGFQSRKDGPATLIASCAAHICCKEPDKKLSRARASSRDHSDLGYRGHQVQSDLTYKKARSQRSSL